MRCRPLTAVLAVLVFLVPASVALAQSGAPGPKGHRVVAVGQRHGTYQAGRASRRLHVHRPPAESTSSPTPTESTSSPTPTAPQETPDAEQSPSPSPTSTSPSSPTPTPAPAPSPELLFDGSRLRNFWLKQAAPGAIAEVPDPAGSGQTVFRFTVGDEDELNISPNPRAELLSPHTINPGDEIWWSAKVFLPADFPASTPNFVNLLQGPYGEPWAGTPPFSIKVEGGTLKWQRNSTYRWDVPWQMPLVRNRWVHFLIHERFGSDGWLELWVDGQPISFFSGDSYNPGRVAPTQRLAMKTMDSSNYAEPNSIYLQSYRKKGMFPSLTIYHGPLLIGTTRAAVEA
jgi:hypothetical protein